MLSVYSVKYIGTSSPAVHDDYRSARGRRPRGRLLFDVNRPRIRVWRTGAHLPHHDPGSRQSGPGIGCTVPDRTVRKRHVVQGPSHHHRTAAQRLLHRVSDRGSISRHRRGRSWIVRPGAAGLADARLQRSSREYRRLVVRLGQRLPRFRQTSHGFEMVEPLPIEPLVAQHFSVCFSKNLFSIFNPAFHPSPSMTRA